jgi:hypothetical protein
LRKVRTPRTKSRTPHVVATCGAPAEKETADSSAFALPKAEAHIAKCAALSKTLAVTALRPILDDLQSGGYTVKGCAILQGSGRLLPALPQILAAHPLIHTAEGVFFRRIFQEALEQLELRVTGFRERDLGEQSAAILGKKTPGLLKRIAACGKKLGPPWTTDQKSATLAAFLLLASEPRHRGAEK